MTRSRWGQFFLFLIVFLAVICVLAPASLVTGFLERATADRLTMAQTEGTLWRGAGVLLLQHDNKFLPLGHYAWHVTPAANLSQIAVSVDTGSDKSTQLLISPWRNEVEVLQGNVSLPAQLLSVFAPQLLPYRLSGELVLTTEHFQITSNSNSGTVTVDWRQATSGLTDIAPLGDYRILLQGAGADLKVSLTTLTGKLQLAGNGQMQVGHALTFNGTAQAAPAQKEALSDLLHHIGPELSPGIFGFALAAQ
ncbi:MAG: proteinral secretion pathway protein N [Gallionellaceae bacterium]|nr:MAG: proteinral secretion pathway protein N [Gallionellaceae bacterium]